MWRVGGADGRSKGTPPPTPFYSPLPTPLFSTTIIPLRNVNDKLVSYQFL